MGYSDNIAAVNRMRPLLDQMLKSTTDLIWPSDDAHMLAYKLREAMVVAEKKGVAPYADLRKQYTIRNKGRKVIAEHKDVVILEALKEGMQKLILEGITSVVEIVGAAILNPNQELYFPDASTSTETCNTLYAWANKNEYFMVVGEGITLTKNDPGDAKWTP